MRSITRFALASVAVTAMATTAWAQQEQRATQQENAAGQVQQAGGRSGEQYLNNVLGTCLLLGNQKEVALLQYAQGKAQHQQVKQFAQTALKDHKDFIMKLQQQGGVRPVVQLRELSVTQSGQDDTGVRPVEARENPQGTQNTSEAWAARMLKIQQEVCQQCLMSTRKELEKKQGQEFDMAFVGMQMAAHMQMLDELKVYQRHATGELRTLLEQGQQATERHLSQLQEIKDQLKGGAQRRNNDS